MHRQSAELDTAESISWPVVAAKVLSADLAGKFPDIGHVVSKVRYVRDYKGNGLLWYVRRIPKHAKPHYGGKEQIRKSLKTRALEVAVVEAAKLARADDAFWAFLKINEDSAD
ncbi:MULTISPECIES: DUF6538 domain-containing protein [unclassified Methylobacterium]|uniref:DUF6538 domain-containing protein n=1 Tax=unclassified Methylobacterium TaxID=2615210 RepID=UPI00226AEA52|nr:MULTISPECIES: DUF6538 domain-containing protein [unclassified Methylobacterium]